MAMSSDDLYNYLSHAFAEQNSGKQNQAAFLLWWEKLKQQISENPESYDHNHYKIIFKNFKFPPVSERKITLLKLIGDLYRIAISLEFLDKIELEHKEHEAKIIELQSTKIANTIIKNDESIAFKNDIKSTDAIDQLTAEAPLFQFECKKDYKENVENKITHHLDQQLDFYQKKLASIKQVAGQFTQHGCLEQFKESLISEIKQEKEMLDKKIIALTTPPSTNTDERFSIYYSRYHKLKKIISRVKNHYQYEENKLDEKNDLAIFKITRFSNNIINILNNIVNATVKEKLTADEIKSTIDKQHSSIKIMVAPETMTAWNNLSTFSTSLNAEWQTNPVQPIPVRINRIKEKRDELLNKLRLLDSTLKKTKLQIKECIKKIDAIEKNLDIDFAKLHKSLTKLVQTENKKHKKNNPWSKTRKEYNTFLNEIIKKNAPKKYKKISIIGNLCSISGILVAIFLGPTGWAIGGILLLFGILLLRKAVKNYRLYRASSHANKTITENSSLISAQHTTRIFKQLNINGPPDQTPPISSTTYQTNRHHPTKQAKTFNQPNITPSFSPTLR